MIHYLIIYKGVVVDVISKFESREEAFLIDKSISISDEYNFDSIDKKDLNDDYVFDSIIKDDTYIYKRGDFYVNEIAYKRIAKYLTDYNPSSTEDDVVIKALQYASAGNKIYDTIGNIINGNTAIEITFNQL